MSQHLALFSLLVYVKVCIFESHADVLLLFFCIIGKTLNLFFLFTCEDTNVCYSYIQTCVPSA